MRVSNNNQTTFGMNPNLDLTKASERLASKVRQHENEITRIGNLVNVCKIKDYGKRGAEVKVQAIIPDGRTVTGRADGPVKKIVEIVEIANSRLNQVLADTYLGLKTIIRPTE